MIVRLFAAINALDQLVDYFVPPTIAANRDARNRARIFLISHLLGPFIGNVVPIAIFALDPSPGYDSMVLAASITGFWIFPPLLRRGMNYDLLALLSIENLIFCIFWSCFFYGGATSPTLAWVLVIPLLAFFYLPPSTKLRAIAMMMFAANVVAFWLLHVAGVGVNERLPLAALQGLGLVSTSAAAIYVAMMASYYAKIQASQGELETEVRQHIATASALREATKEAARAGEAKADFLAKMSHELRTPLNAVIGYSQILLEDAEAEGDTGCVSDLIKIHDAAQHLLKLVGEILDLSKIEAGKMALDEHEFDLATVLCEAADAAVESIRKNGNRFVRDLPAGLGTAKLDEAKLRNILRQLLDNAAKFTQNGEVELSATRYSGAKGDRVVIRISDTGIGISPEQIPQLFEHFTVLDDSSTSKYGGTGLGLALAQRLCRLMRGDILVESDVGKGSRFTIELPIAHDQTSIALFADITLAPADPVGGCPTDADLAHV